jgi:2-keto-3-deoxy-L-fuconate dehydrogenase
VAGYRTHYAPGRRETGKCGGEPHFCAKVTREDGARDRLESAGRPDFMTDQKNQGQLFRLDRKTAVVTGGASGIGQAIAQLFAASGATVRIADVNSERAETVARQIADSGGQATAHVGDLSSEDGAAKVFAGILEHGRVDILVNSVGMSNIGTLETTSASDFDLLFRVNVQSFFFSMRALISHMKSNGGGVILNLASTAASLGIADRFAYSMSKGAVRSMTISVAKDYLQHNIRCNCISPARVHTPFVDNYIKKNYPGREEELFQTLSASQPIGRMGQPQEVGALALFLCSDQAGFITGNDYPIDGGFFNLRG